jgi:hypothetical protein
LIAAPQYWPDAAAVPSAGVARTGCGCGKSEPPSPAILVPQAQPPVNPILEDQAPILVPPPLAGETSCLASEFRPGCDEVRPPKYTFYSRADMLFLWWKDSHLPPLVTTGSADDARPGALGQPGTVTLFGGTLENEWHYGGRLTIGYWLSNDHLLGLEGSLLYLGRRSSQFQTASAGTSLVTIPVLNAATGTEDTVFLAAPGGPSGAATASLSNRMWGAEANFRSEVHQGRHYRVFVLFGFRYLELLEDLGLATSEAGAPGVVAPSITRLTSTDRFDTGNYFYGGQVGGQVEYWMGRLFAGGLLKVALGDNRQVVGINGNTLVTGTSGLVTAHPGGIFALPSNIGRYGRDEFAVVPEVGLTLGFQVSCHLRASVGYNFLYLSNVVRPGDQIDRAINPTQFLPILGAGTATGPALPAFHFKNTDFWAHGANVSLEFRF